MLILFEKNRSNVVDVFRSEQVILKPTNLVANRTRNERDELVEDSAANICIDTADKIRCSIDILRVDPI